MNISKFIEELKRRNVIKVATAYAIAGWLIIQIATSVFPAFNFPDWTQQFVIILVGIGLPLSLIFAWAFELTPEGIKKSKEVEITESVTDRTGKKLNGIIIAILSVALFFVLIERIFFAKSSILESSEQSTQFENASIAVLPFVNMSDDRNNEFFSDGLSEELLNGLAKLEDIQVAGRTSSFQFKGSNPDLRDVGTQLGVKHILEGSVRKSGNRVRITAQLIQADNGFHLWSETYDRELTANDVFDIQEEITRQVVEELKIRLLPEEELVLDERPTEDIEAYNAFLEATQREITRQPEDIEFAINKYKEAVRIDPTFSLAFARMAYAYSLLYVNGSISLEEAREESRRNIDQALTINGNEGKAYQAMATYYNNLEIDYERAENAAKRAVDLLPNDAMANNMLQITYGSNEKEDLQEETLMKAYNLDPLNPIIAGNYSGTLVQKERYEEALEIVDDIILRYPENSRALTRKAGILASIPYGKIDEGFEFTYEAYRLDRKDLNLINALIAFSYDLELNALAEFLETERSKYYPENSNEQLSSIRDHFNEGRYDSAELELEQFLDQFGDAMRDNWHIFLSQIYYHQERIEDGVTILEKYNPELLEEDFELNDFNSFPASLYLKFKNEAGAFPERAILEGKICQFHDERAIESKNEGRVVEAFYDEIWCDILQGNIDVVIEAMEFGHFEQKNKQGWPQFANSENIMFKEILESQEFQNLYMRIEEDLHGMRDNVVEYLKTEGEWREEWEIE
ncbi:MAG: hypothetical protein BalsKO_26610 [Balneolaceae bacterium]